MHPGWQEWRHRSRTPASAVFRPVQVVYRALVKERLGPSFRELGFVGSAGRYALRTDRRFSLMSLQKSAYSDASEIRFTINLLSVHEDVWAGYRAERPYLPERPAAGTRYGGPVATARIGELLPEPADTWWRVEAAVDEDAVVDDVVAAVRDVGRPWLLRHAA